MGPKVTLNTRPPSRRFFSNEMGDGSEKTQSTLLLFKLSLRNTLMTLLRGEAFRVKMSNGVVLTQITPRRF
jgi:hypothetical protein